MLCEDADLFLQNFETDYKIHAASYATDIRLFIYPE